MERLQTRNPLGETGLDIPPIIFGTSCLGNLYQALADETKLAIMREWFEWVEPPVVIDSAGKYGAGLALEVIGNGLRRLGVRPDQIGISNKLGWKRVPLRTPEPLFEPGAWADLEHDAEQCISYDGILECWRQGCELLGSDYAPELVSVHDPDEYISAAETEKDLRARWEDVIGAYRALEALKQDGSVKGVGVGAKEWTVIREIAEKVHLDWAMFACGPTIYHHPPELVQFMNDLAADGVGIINSAVFHAGFLVGGSYFDYRRVDPDDPGDRALFDWRERFFAVCRRFDVAPATACIQFGLSAPGVVSVSLNTSKPRRVSDNVAAVCAHVPDEFWTALREDELIDPNYAGLQE